MLRQILFKTLSFSAIAAVGLIVFNPLSSSGFSEAYAMCDEPAYGNCMDSCIPACRAWYGPGITYEECWNECHYTMCGPWHDCL
jgi:hypothetical protein